MKSIVTGGKTFIGEKVQLSRAVVAVYFNTSNIFDSTIVSGDLFQEPGFYVHRCN